MTQASPPMPPRMPAGSPGAPAPQGGRGMAAAALGLGISAIVPCLGIVTGIIAIVLGIVSLAKRKAGQGMAIAGIATGFLGMTVGQAIGAAITAILVPVFMAGVSDTHEAVCKTNLRTIGSAIRDYKHGHADTYPPDLGALISDGFIPPRALRCPASAEGTSRWVSLKEGAKVACDYFYLAPVPGADGPTIVACDYEGNHKGGRCVLYHIGRPEFLEEAEFQDRLAWPENAAFAEALRKAEPARATRPALSPPVER